MKDILLSLFGYNPFIAVGVSILLNIIISIAGIIPSAFLTSANIAFFGFSTGLFISIAGEALGAIISFYIYRKGISKLKSTFTFKHPMIERLKQTDNGDGFFLVIILRLIPFVPSGVVTAAAAFSQMGLLTFAISSTIGKFPSLLLEATSVYFLFQLPSHWIIIIISLLIAFWLLFRLIKKDKA